MKHIKFGDMLTVKKGILVHGCNAQGVMGGGIAKQVKEMYPACFEEYRMDLLMRAHAGYNALGHNIPHVVSEELIIINAITQDRYGTEKRHVDYAAVQRCFTQIVQFAHDEDYHVHYPQVGAGLAGGDWEILNDIIDTVFAEFAPDVERTLWIYEK